MAFLPRSVTMTNSFKTTLRAFTLALSQSKLLQNQLRAIANQPKILQLQEIHKIERQTKQ